MCFHKNRYLRRVSNQQTPKIIFTFITWQYEYKLCLHFSFILTGKSQYRD